MPVSSDICVSPSAALHFSAINDCLETIAVYRDADDLSSLVSAVTSVSGAACAGTATVCTSVTGLLSLLHSATCLATKHESLWTIASQVRVPLRICFYSL